MSFRNTIKVSSVVLLTSVGISVLTGCSGGVYDRLLERRPGEIGRSHESDKRETIWGEDGLSFGGDKPKPGAGGGGGLGVNSYLWRATLDTISFMPVTSADPFGGVILTDWFSPPETPNERFKVNVYILGLTLRADGLRVSLFRQVMKNSGWVDAVVDKDAARKFEDSILTRARQLRNINRQADN